MSNMMLNSASVMVAFDYGRRFVPGDRKRSL
jgi:hypothetical protein